MRYLVFFLLYCSPMIQAQDSEMRPIQDSSENYSFEYREPYFQKNFNSKFRADNKTHTIEETWGLWGHNISKFVRVKESMLSVINGGINSSQFCFSSPELSASLEQAISENTQNQSSITKFMVMPNDNDLVCQCDQCKAVGNTKKNASPAVFTLLNHLAKRFPELQFFSTAYLSTQTPPCFKLHSNVGVMISTMSFPKGVVLKESSKLPFVTNSIEAWKKIANKIYLWDYAINFDNYFEFYPTVLITQKNIQLYKELGISGIFMHGNEDSYSTFSDLKCYLYAQILQDPYQDLDFHIKSYFDSNYPSINTLLYNYYLRIEQAALDSKQTLDIYGGMQQSFNKYLNKNDFEEFYQQFQKEYKKTSKVRQQELAPLMLALSFQWIEIRRTTEAIKTKSIKRKYLKKLKYLSNLQKKTNIEIYNETGSTIADYIALWEEEILKASHKNIFYNKPFKLLSIRDEDYQNSKMLNDGLLGFTDYYNNWFLATVDNIKLQINAIDVKRAKKVEMCFLEDQKHNIFLPDYVIIRIDGTVVKKKINPNGKRKNKIEIPINLKHKSQLITIEIIKQKKFINNSIACDEIFFK